MYLNLSGSFWFYICNKPVMKIQALLLFSLFFTSCNGFTTFVKTDLVKVAVNEDLDGDGIKAKLDCNDTDAMIGRGFAIHDKVAIANDLLSYQKKESSSLNDYKSLKITFKCDLPLMANELLIGEKSSFKEAVYYYFQNDQKVFQAKTIPGNNGSNAYTHFTSHANNLLVSSHLLIPSSLHSLPEEKEAQSEVHASPNGAYVLYDRALPRITTIVNGTGVLFRNYSLGNINQLYINGATSLRTLPITLKKDLNNFGELVVENRIYSLSAKTFINLGAYNSNSVLSIDLFTKIALIDLQGNLALINYETKSKIMDINIPVNSSSSYFLRGDKIFTSVESNELTVVSFDINQNTYKELLIASSVAFEKFNQDHITPDGRFVTYEDNGVVIIDLEMKLKTIFPVDSGLTILNINISHDGQSIYAFTESDKPNRISDVVTWINPLKWITL